MSNQDDHGVQMSAEDMIVEDLEGRDKVGSSVNSGGPKRGRKIAGNPSSHSSSSSNKTGALTTANLNKHLIPGAAQLGEPQRKKKKLLWQKGKLIGSGGFGKVFLGLDGNSGTLVAGKEFCFDGGNIDQKLKELGSEMKLMQKLNHKNIVRYYGADKRESLFYIFMEYVPGGSLRSILDQFGPLQDRVASRFAKQILTGLGYLHHHQVIHRDIKCANVLVNVDGVVKLADFGSAQFFTEAEGTHGTPFWMPPEVIRGEAVGWQCDIWSLGCSLIEMLTGETPFKEIGPNMKILYYIAGNDPIQISEKIVEPHVRDFISQCLQRDPTQRPTVRTLLEHEFITMYTRRINTGDSQLLNASTASYMQIQGRTVAQSMASSPVMEFETGTVCKDSESPPSRDIELESIASHDLVPADGSNIPNPLQGGGGQILCRASLDALDDGTNVRDLEELDEELDDDVKHALVNRAMSFATLRSSGNRNPSNTGAGVPHPPGRQREPPTVASPTDRQLEAASRKPATEGKLFAVVNVGDPTVSVADSMLGGSLLGGSTTVATGSESVLSMMTNIVEVNKNDVIEIELEEEIQQMSPDPSGTAGENMMYGSQDPSIEGYSPRQSPNERTNRSSGEFEGTKSRRSSCTTMQLLQLAVTILLVGVIAALATLLILKE